MPLATRTVGCLRYFRPARVFVREDAAKYPLAKELIARFQADGIDVKTVRRVQGIPGDTPRQSFFEAKRTLVLSVRKKAPLQGCRPSANWQLPFVSGCPGHCHYCYLNTSFGPKPYVRVYVNVDEILGHAEEYIERRRPMVTIFEGSATSDPIPLEHWTGSLRRAVLHFAKHPYGRFRIATKYDGVDSLLGLEHNDHTRIRFTINSERVISGWDKATASLARRLAAAEKVAQAGYPFGFLVGPIVLYDGWEDEYVRLIEQIAERFDKAERERMSFELITHRFTPTAKELIERVYVDTDLPMDTSDRAWSYGQFGYGKWKYAPHAYGRVQQIVKGAIGRMIPEAKVMYLV